jgi:hypothetical protein
MGFEVYLVLYLHPESGLRPARKVFEEARMAKSGLVLHPTSLPVTDQLGGLRPNWILESEEQKKSAIVDLYRPSDVHHGQLLAADMRKQQAYHSLMEAVGYYTEQGWVVHVFLWVVGSRGMLDTLHVEYFLKFTTSRGNIGGSSRTNSTCLCSSVSLSSQGALPNLDPECSSSTSDEEVSVAATKQKY